MVLFPFTHLQRKKKNGFERKEGDGKDGFILIHPIAEKKKTGSKKKKMMERIKKWVSGNEVMGLLMGVWLFI